MDSNRDVRLPASTLVALRKALVRELGMEAAAPALQEAGYAAGDALFERLSRTAGTDLAQTSSGNFWKRLGSLFRELGWGSIEHQELHPGVGALVAREWFEADPDSATSACPVTTGVLANLLGRVAGQDVAVMQAPCDDGETRCVRFLFGSGPVLQDVYRTLREGHRLEEALPSGG